MILRFGIHARLSGRSNASEPTPKEAGCAGAEDGENSPPRIVLYPSEIRARFGPRQFRLCSHFRTAQPYRGGGGRLRYRRGEAWGCDWASWSWNLGLPVLGAESSCTLVGSSWSCHRFKCRSRVCWMRFTLLECFVVVVESGEGRHSRPICAVRRKYIASLNGRRLTI